MGLYLRKADFKDCDVLFNWANDDEVRKNSFNQNKILYGDHIVWFNKVIYDFHIVFWKYPFGSGEN